MTSRFFYNGHTYVIETVARSYAGAKAAAQAQGAHLAKIETFGENSAVFNNVKNLAGTAGMPSAPDGGGGKYVWIGASDIAVEGTWRWHDGSLVSFNKWGSGPLGTEPDDFNGQDAGAMGFTIWPLPSGGIGYIGEWNDVDVTNLLWSVFEFDYLRGTGAGETINGTSGANTIRGLAGNDRLNGLGGADRIEGGDNNDTIVGGANGDQLFGGSGLDTFLYAASTDSGLTANRDTINDLIRSQGDRIDLRPVDARPATLVNDAFVKDTGGGFTVGEYRLMVSGANTVVQLNLDGDTIPEMSILVLNRTNLGSLDIYF